MVEQGPQKRWHQHDPGHSFSGQTLQQFFRIPHYVRPQYHTRNTRQQRPENLPHRIHKPQIRLLATHLAPLKRIPFPHPPEPVNRSPMRPLHSFRPSTRSRRVQHVGWISRVNLRRQIVHGFSRDPVPVCVQSHRFDIANRKLFESSALRHY